MRACPLGCIEPHDHVVEAPDPDSLSGPTMPLSPPDFDSPSHPLPESEAEASGDPGGTTTGDRQTIRVRLQLQGEWRYTRGVWFPSLGIVEVYGNTEMELDQGSALTLEEAVGVTAAVCFEQFHDG